MSEHILRGSTFQLRPFRPDDVPALARYADNRKIWANVRDHFPHPYTEEHARAYIEKLQEMPELVFAIEHEGEAVGSIGLKTMGDPIYRFTRELGFWLGEPFWGHGIMSEAVGLIARLAFEDLGLRRLHAEVFTHNPASMHLLLKNGFRREGLLRQAAIKDGKMVDMHLFGRLREDK